MAQQQQQQQWSNNYPNYIDPYGDAYTNQFNYSYQYLQQQYQQQAPYPYRYGDQAIPPQHSYVHDLEHQTQQRQALGAAAAATLTSTLRPSATVPERSAVSYADIANKPNGGGSCCYTWFHSAEAMQQHQSKHQKCHLCSYEAVKVLVEDHLYHTHGIGKKKTKPDGVIPANAPKLDTPEAIEAWIAARKKNYPTAANIERKKKEAEAKGNQQQQKQTVQSGSSNNGLVNYESDDDDDDDDPEKEEEEENDLIDETRDAVSSKDPSMMGKRALPEEPRRAGRRCRYFAAGYCRHGDQCNFVHEKPPQRQKIQSGPRHNQHHQRQPNLLRKLLDREIKQEQSVILQCLRYIVDNDFFGHGK